MVSRYTKRKQKKLLEQSRVEEPPLVVNCICCHCNGVFQPFDMKGAYLDRRCPSCNGRLDEAGYDAARETLSWEINELEKEASIAAEEGARWQTWACRLRWIPIKPLRRALERKADLFQSRKNELVRKATTRRRRFFILATSRYYTGEWFQRTHIPLKRTVVSPYRIIVSYEESGTWQIRHTDKLTSGMVAEYLAFQRLLESVRNPASPLFEAQIVPNIYLPHEQQHGKAEKLWSQIDCVLLTRQAAFIIEVKRRRRHVLAPKPFEKIWSTYDTEAAESFAGSNPADEPDSELFANESLALKQNSRHAVEFDDMCSAYPFERIFEQIVYVGTRSFHTDCNTFVDNVNVSHLGQHEPDFVNIIEAACEKMEDVIGQEALEKLGESFVTAYGDLNQKRWLLHKQRINSVFRE